MGTEQEYRQKESDMKGPDQATDAGPEMIGGKTQLQTPDAQVLEEKPQIQGEEPQIQEEKPQIQEEEPQIQEEKPQIQGEEPQVPEEEVRISVRGLVEFILRHGDIDNRHYASPENAMQEGGRIHRMIQRRMAGGDRKSVV